MAEVIEKTGKTVDEAFQAALSELGMSAEQVTMEVLEQPQKKMFGLFTKPAKIRVTVKEAPAAPVEEMVAAFSAATATAEEPIAAAPAPAEAAPAVEAPAAEKAPVNEAALATGMKFLAEIFRLMHMDVKMETKELENAVCISLIGEDLGIIIGKHGQTLDSLQYLCNLAANRGQQGSKLHIVIDIEDYRTRREETLVNLANRLSEKVKRTGRRITLEPMNRHERKIIHMALQDNDKVYTRSFGDEPYRKVVIEPKFKERRRHYDHRGSRPVRETAPEEESREQEES